MEEELFQMMAGAVSVLSAAGCALVGGHSSEGPEPALGFSITGALLPFSWACLQQAMAAAAPPLHSFTVQLPCHGCHIDSKCT
jgi:hypothetical protein